MDHPEIGQVLREEREQINASRRLRHESSAPIPPAEKSSIGLAFSGGGIRSATFNLGVLQALAQAKLLHAFDYLSTVSGGGYIGGWLMGWMHHEGCGIGRIEEELASKAYSESAPGERPEVHFLRDYSNYLTPRKGILTADFWAFVCSYLRNTILNLMILLLSLLALLLVPYGLAYILNAFEAEEIEWKWTVFHELVRSQDLAVALGAVLGLVAIGFMGRNLLCMDAWKTRGAAEKSGATPEEKEKAGYPWYAEQWAIQVFIVIPLFVAAALFSYGFYYYLKDWKAAGAVIWIAPVVGALLYLGMWVFAFGLNGFSAARKRMVARVKDVWWAMLCSAVIAGAAGGFLLLAFAKVMEQAEVPTYWPAGQWHILTFGTPALMGIMLLVGVLQIGLMGGSMSDALREWWARLGGWLMIYCFCWLGLFLVAIYAPVALGKLWEARGRFQYTITIGSLTWLASTVFGIMAGKSVKSGAPGPDAKFMEKALSFLTKLTPYIFILGLLIALAVLDKRIVAAVSQAPFVAAVAPGDAVDWIAPVTGVIFFLAAFGLSSRVGINEFSVHHLYRNRLVRCYLGASAKNRQPQPFTGFSSSDDFQLADLEAAPGSAPEKLARPIPILNASLNVTRGKELAVQTRKARSFAFTPRYCGFTRVYSGTDAREWESGYAPTKLSSSAKPKGKEGLSVGTAIAISGAAASPNMGSYSSAPLAFMMTLFDVRLGWWLGNPAKLKREDAEKGIFSALRGRVYARKKERWEKGSPKIGFYWLLRELFGAASDDGDFIYLSDGGHFENLALYELVRRGCRLIVVSDASCDPEYKFGDLHNAIERCRSDFGVEIEIDTSALVPQDGLAKTHYIRGTVRYDPQSPDRDGTLLYLKPALLAGDPADVLGYKSVNSCFPHDSTADQWFDEAHFENYRALGKAVGAAACQDIEAQVKSILRL